WWAKAPGKDASSRRGAAPAVSVMTLHSFRLARLARSRKCPRRRRTFKAIVDRRCARFSRSSGGGARRESAAARLVRALSVVRAEMPVLRLQLVHAQGTVARRALHRHIAARPGRAAARRRRP